MAQTLRSEAVNHFVDDLKTTHGDNLNSVLIYGSGSALKEAEIASEFSLVVVLERISAEDLQLARSPVREWQRIGYPAPSYFSIGELHEASDVFPIEFRKMEQARKILYGTDPFEFIELSDVNLRHQTEYELRSKLLQLRRLYIESLTSVEQLTKLMVESLASFASLFRPVLLLMGVDPPVSKVQCIRETVVRLGLEAEPFERIFALRTSAEQLADEVSINQLFATYMRQIERVIDAVDKFEN